MGKYITKFETQALFDEAKDNLDKPHVSLTVDNNTVHYLRQQAPQPVVRPNFTFSEKLPVILSEEYSVEFKMTSDIPIDKKSMSEHLCVSGKASTGQGEQDFEITNWLVETDTLSGNAGSGSVLIEPDDEWGGTSFRITIQNSYESARINEIVWND